MTTPITPGGPSAVPTAPAGNDLNSPGLGKDAFLKLLVAQLRFQNPSSPTDGQQFMAQMAQFTQVEKLADLVTAQTQALTWNKNVAAEGMIGKTVSGTGADGTAVTDSVIGLTMGTAGPMLRLSRGGTLAVDGVTSVTTTVPGDSSQSPAPR